MTEPTQPPKNSPCHSSFHAFNPRARRAQTTLPVNKHLVLPYYVLS